MPCVWLMMAGNICCISLIRKQIGVPLEMSHAIWTQTWLSAEVLRVGCVHMRVGSRPTVVALCHDLCGSMATGLKGTVCWKNTVVSICIG